MFGYIYKITNKLNGKIYVGKRQRASFDPYYYGSGIAISSAILKYGKDSFDREILEWCNDHESLCKQEQFWIKTLNAQDPEIGYNIASGGEGNSTGGKQNSLYCFVYKESETSFLRILKTDLQLFLDNGFLRGKGPNTNGLAGYKKPEAVKEKIRQSNLGKHNHQGENNPCFGIKYKWVTNGEHSIRLPLDEEIPEGYYPGKTQKKYLPSDSQLAHYKKITKQNSALWKGENNPVYKKALWYTDGITEIKTIGCPDGYHLGRLKNENKVNK